MDIILLLQCCVCHRVDLVHLDVVVIPRTVPILSIVVASLPGEVVDSKTLAPCYPPLAAEAEDWRKDYLETAQEQTTHHPPDSSRRETDGGGGETAELDPGVDNILPRVNLPVVDEQEEAAKKVATGQ